LVRAFEHMRETMKKILFASTALVAFAGAASAEVVVGGSAEIGVVGGDWMYSASQFWTDVEVTFTMTGEADNGLTFGAAIDLDEAANANGTNDGGATWFVAYGNARLDMGDTDGAYDWALQEVNLAGGSIDDAETTHVGFSGNSGFDGGFDGQIARFTYTFGDFAAAMSAEVDDSGTFDPIWGLGVKYSGDLGGTTFGVGLGYQDQEQTGDLMGISVDAGLASGVSFAVNYAEFNPVGGGANTTHTAVGIGYEMNALAIGLNWGEFESGGASVDGYGLAAAYDLGGGLSAQFGYGYSDLGGGLDFDQYSLGLAMSF